MPQRPPVHRPAVLPAVGQRERQADRERGRKIDRRLRGTRGYRRFRLWKLRQCSLCQDCQERGELTPAEDVHHTRGLERHPEDLCSDEYTLTLCHGCHAVRTNRGE